jgi:hypothetical protein
MLCNKYLWSRHFLETDFTTSALAQSAIEVSMAAQIISWIVAGSLSALAATGEDHCTIWYELLYSVM